MSNRVDLKKARIIAGIADEKAERIMVSQDISQSVFEHSFKDSFESSGFLYIRADCETVLEKICFTNPIWVVDK